MIQVCKFTFILMIAAMSGFAQVDTVNSFTGVEGFVINQTKLSDLEGGYPEATFHKYHDEQTFPELFGWGRWVVYFEQRGIILTFRRRTRLSSFKLSRITLTPNFSGVTEVGIKVGSTYQEVCDAYGKSTLFRHGERVFLSYNSARDKRDLGIGTMEFICSSGCDSKADFKVEKIVIN